MSSFQGVLVEGFHCTCYVHYELLGPGEERPTVHRKNILPPYIQQRPLSEAIIPKAHKPQSESTVKAQMSYWYKPQFSREEAISFVHGLDPGSFIVRDSTTVPGGYAITIKISQEQVRQRRNMTKGMPVFHLFDGGQYLRPGCVVEALYYLTQ